jgi:hypothetical protein
MMQGWRKADPPTLKKLPVEANVPKLLSKVGLPNELNIAIGGLALIAFYFLLCVGEYTIKSTRNKNSKQTVQSLSRVSPSSNVTQLEIYNN